jgi:DNA-binding MarR family transcriptional regulator
MAEPEIVRACRALYAAIDRLDQAAADHIGVARSDLRCLNLLEKGPQRPAEIARSLGLTTGSITALLDRLEKKGLIERTNDPGDRRGLLVRPTALVFAELGPIFRMVAITLAATVERYSDQERTEAVKHLDDVTRACEIALAKVRNESSEGSHSSI